MVACHLFQQLRMNRGRHWTWAWVQNNLQMEITSWTMSQCHSRLCRILSGLGAVKLKSSVGMLGKNKHCTGLDLLGEKSCRITCFSSNTKASVFVWTPSERYGALLVKTHKAVIRTLQTDQENKN